MSNSIELFGPINLWCSKIRYCYWFFLEGRMRVDYLFFETKQEGLIQMNKNTHPNAGAREAGRISRYLPQRNSSVLLPSISRKGKRGKRLRVFSAGALVRLVFEPGPGWMWKEKAGCCNPSRSSNQYWNNWCIRVPAPQNTISSVAGMHKEGMGGWSAVLSQVRQRDENHQLYQWAWCHPQISEHVNMRDFEILEHLRLWEDKTTLERAPPDLISEKSYEPYDDGRSLP